MYTFFLLLYYFRELLHTKKRRDDACDRLHDVLGESCTNVDIRSAGYKNDSIPSISSLSEEAARELFRSELSETEERSQALSTDVKKLKRANVIIDNSLSPAHSLLQINCVDHKGFLYDIMRVLKDFDIQVTLCICTYTYTSYMSHFCLIYLINDKCCCVVFEFLTDSLWEIFAC